jgi:excisionase family DNA binding protein
VTPEPPLTLTVEQAAQLLGISRGLAYQAARDGDLPTIRLGRRLLVPRHALERMLGVEGLRDNDRAPPSGGETKAAGRSP